MKEAESLGFSREYLEVKRAGHEDARLAVEVSALSGSILYLVSGACIFVAGFYRKARVGGVALGVLWILGIVYAMITRDVPLHI